MFPLKLSWLYPVFHTGMLQKTNRTCYVWAREFENDKLSITTSFPFCFDHSAHSCCTYHWRIKGGGGTKGACAPPSWQRGEDLFLILFVCKSLCPLPYNKWRLLFTFIHQLKMLPTFLSPPPPPPTKKYWIRHCMWYVLCTADLKALVNIVVDI